MKSYAAVVTYFPPTQGPGRPFGEPTPRINEQELQEEAHRHEVEEGLRARGVPRRGFFSRLFRRRSAAKRSDPG